MVHNIIYFESTYFRAAKFSRIKPSVTFLRGHIFKPLVTNSILPIMIYIFTHIIFIAFRTWSQMHEMRENFYVYSSYRKMIM